MRRKIRRHRQAWQLLLLTCLLLHHIETLLLSSIETTSFSLHGDACTTTYVGHCPTTSDEHACCIMYSTQPHRPPRLFFHMHINHPHANNLVYIFTSWLLQQDWLRTAETASSNYHFDRQKSIIGINWNTITNSLSMCANLQGNTGLLAWSPTTQSRSCGSVITLFLVAQNFLVTDIVAHFAQNFQETSRPLDDDNE